MWKLIITLGALIGITQAKPATAEVETVGIPPLITFDKGNVGVNFLGFRASAGLGGLLTGNAADGGLHAEAGTPFGQAAAAGLGGSVDGNGRSAGGLYAGATAGGNVRAAAGLGGVAGAEGASGVSYSGASAGGAATHITKLVNKPATIRKDVEIIAEQPKKEVYIERELIKPTYVQKTVQFPSYVGKIDVSPTVVGKTVVTEEIEAPEVVKVVQKTRVKTRPHHHSRIHIHKHLGFFGPPPPPVVYQREKSFDVATAPVGYNKEVNYNVGAGYAGGGSQFFNDIFNIPISTLTAVNKLVGGIADGTAGSVHVSKSVGASASI